MHPYLKDALREDSICSLCVLYSIERLKPHNLIICYKRAHASDTVTAKLATPPDPACPCLEHHFRVHVALRSKLGAMGGKKEPREGGKEFTTRSVILGPVCPFPIMPATICFLDSSDSCSAHTVHILISSSGREGIECTFSVLPGTRTVL